MSRMSHIILCALVVPAVAFAQGKPVVEIGTNLGVTVSSANGSTLTHVGVPGGGILGLSTLYATFFAGPSMMVEPQVALNVFSGGGSSITTVALGGQLGYLFKSATENSPFVAASLALQSSSEGTRTDFGAGAKFGYRVLSGSSLGVRFEAGYRRWFDNKLNEISFGIGIGGILRKDK